eukprot:scaffold46287_cov38-Prasinocladus_malaysianus.AAC.1
MRDKVVCRRKEHLCRHTKSSQGQGLNATHALHGGNHVLRAHKAKVSMQHMPSMSRGSMRLALPRNLCTVL